MPMVVYTEEEVIDKCNEAEALGANRAASDRAYYMNENTQLRRSLVCAIADLRPQADWPEEVRGLVGWARQVKKKFGFEVVSSDALDWDVLAETGEIKRAWLPMDSYQTGDSRDESGKWHPGPPGPMVELKMKTGKIIRAQWRGEPTKGGGMAYAFWQDGSQSGIGIYDPDGWREIATAQA